MCLLETLLLFCCFFFPSMMFKTNDRVQSLLLQTSQSDSRNSSHLKVSIRIYSYLKVREGNRRDVVRIYRYLSALCRFNGTHQSADFRTIRNDPLLPATIGSCVLRTHQEIRPRPHFFCGRLRFDPKLSARVRKCVCDWGRSGRGF